MTSSLPWWRTDAYTDDTALPAPVEMFAGPRGVALVRAWPDGRTSEGWGLTGPRGSDGFMPRYGRGEFDPRRALHGYRNGRWNFAIVMRSVQLVCIDIDGKNGGLEHAKRLGMMPPTLAETSKSGDGFHLFYVTDETWMPGAGFGRFSDRIGIEQGVDIRATGCVYHHPQQRWNDRPPVALPGHLATLLLQREQKLAATTERISKVLDSHDDMEILMMQDEMLADLAKPIPTGKRNNTLFAIGSQLAHAQVPGWQEKVGDRATQLGLSVEESDKLIANIERYGQTP